MKFTKATLLITLTLTTKILAQSPIPEPGTKFGYIGLDNPDLKIAKDQMYYMFFPSRANPTKDPLVIWLTGGPGCSSELAIAYENGPFSIDPATKKAVKRDWSWNNNANLLFVDNPVGTGFSICGSGNYAKTEEDVQRNFYTFFTGWLSKDDFSQFKGRDLYITGESYAGHYIPYISNFFYNANNPDINLRGIAIGNGMSNPNLQYSQYITYATLPENAEYTKVSDTDKTTLEKVTNLCLQMSNFRNPLMANGYKDVCEIMNGVILETNDPNLNMKFNVYDITKQCLKKDPLCYDISFIEDFFNQEAVQKYLGVNKKWVPCDGDTGAAIRPADWWNSAADQVVDLLEGGIKVLVYSGVLDYICNWRGGDLWTRSVRWSGQAGFANSPFVKKEKGYGESRKFANFEFLKFYGAGHMVPLDKAKESVQMLNELIGQPVPA